MESSQDQLFGSVEGNSWFRRNEQALSLFDPAADLPLKTIDLYQLKPKSVIEVGAANGFRLAEIARRYNSRVVAVEASVEAINDGKRKFPHIEFVSGLAKSIPVEESFDLAIVNFVFHWIDRNNLLRSAAEIDRLIIEGGFLIIGDFFPFNFMKVPYHHLADQQVYTYKQNYAAIFLASGLYHPVCLLTAEHKSKELTGEASENERFGVWLLRKALKEHYIENGPTN